MRKILSVLLRVFAIAVLIASYASPWLVRSVAAYSVSDGYASVVMNDNPFFFWQGDHSTGSCPNTIYDSSTVGTHTGTQQSSCYSFTDNASIVAGSSTWTHSESDGNTKHYASSALTTTQFNQTDWTFETWIGGSNTGQWDLLQTYASANPYVELTATTSTLYVNWRDSAAVTTPGLSFAVNIFDGQPHYIALVRCWTCSPATVTLWLDGNSVSHTESGNGTITTGTASQWVFLQNYRWQDAAFYTSALSSSRVAAHRSAGNDANTYTVNLTGAVCVVRPGVIDNSICGRGDTYLGGSTVAVFVNHKFYGSADTDALGFWNKSVSVHMSDTVDWYLWSWPAEYTFSTAWLEGGGVPWEIASVPGNINGYGDFVFDLPQGNARTVITESGGSSPNGNSLTWGKYGPTFGFGGGGGVTSTITGTGLTTWRFNADGDGQICVGPTCQTVNGKQQIVLPPGVIYTPWGTVTLTDYTAANNDQGTPQATPTPGPTSTAEPPLPLPLTPEPPFTPNPATPQPTTAPVGATATAAALATAYAQATADTAATAEAIATEQAQATATAIAQATATQSALDTQATATTVAAQATATAQANATATQYAYYQQATLTAIAVQATQTAVAIPTATWVVFQQTQQALIPTAQPTNTLTVAQATATAVYVQTQTAYGTVFATPTPYPVATSPAQTTETQITNWPACFQDMGQCLQMLFSPTVTEDQIMGRLQTTINSRIGIADWLYLQNWLRSWNPVYSCWTFNVPFSTFNSDGSTHATYNSGTTICASNPVVTQIRQFVSAGLILFAIIAVIAVVKALIGFRSGTDPGLEGET